MPERAYSDPTYWEMSSPSERSASEMAVAAGMRYAAIHLGDADDAAAPVASVLEVPPGGMLLRHAHSCWRWEMLVKGSWICPDGTEIVPGDVRYSGPNEFYGPLTAGPEGALTVEVFSRADRDVQWAEDQGEAGAAILARVQAAVQEQNA